MSEETLFELPAVEKRRDPAPTLPGEARVVRPVRDQLEWGIVDLESLLPQDHPARGIWSYLQMLDLSAFYKRIKAVENRPGRPTTDPQVLLALSDDLLDTILGPSASLGMTRVRLGMARVRPGAEEVRPEVTCGRASPRR